MPLEEAAQEGSTYESASWLQPDSGASVAVATLALPKSIGTVVSVVEVSVNLLSFTGGEVQIFPSLTAEPILFKE
jgi:hypothetical protein